MKRSVFSFFDGLFRNILSIHRGTWTCRLKSSINPLPICPVCLFCNREVFFNGGKRGYFFNGGKRNFFQRGKEGS